MVIEAPNFVGLLRPRTYKSENGILKPCLCVLYQTAHKKTTLKPDQQSAIVIGVGDARKLPMAIIFSNSRLMSGYSNLLFSQHTPLTVLRLQRFLCKVTIIAFHPSSRRMAHIESLTAHLLSNTVVSRRQLSSRRWTRVYEKGTDSRDVSVS
jgi:hypothetical protein